MCDFDGNEASCWLEANEKMLSEKYFAPLEKRLELESAGKYMLFYVISYPSFLMITKLA